MNGFLYLCDDLMSDKRWLVDLFPLSLYYKQDFRPPFEPGENVEPASLRTVSQ